MTEPAPSRGFRHLHRAGRAGRPQIRKSRGNDLGADRGQMQAPDVVMATEPAWLGTGVHPRAGSGPRGTRARSPSSKEQKGGTFSVMEIDEVGFVTRSLNLEIQRPSLLLPGSNLPASCLPACQTLGRERCDSCAFPCGASWASPRRTRRGEVGFGLAYVAPNRGAPRLSGETWRMLFRGEVQLWEVVGGGGLECVCA